MAAGAAQFRDDRMSTSTTVPGENAGAGQQQADTVGRPATIDDVPLTLNLADLVPDQDGEIVILDSAGGAVRLIAGEQIIGQGLATPHVTQAGIDVSGMSFLSFQSGITIYYAGGEGLSVSNGDPGAGTL